MADTALIAQYTQARERSDAAVLESFHAVKHAYRFGASFEHIATCDLNGLLREADMYAPDILSYLQEQAVDVSAETIRTFTSNGVESEVAAIVQRPEYSPEDVSTSAPVVCLEEPSHLGNLGAVIRVAAAANAAGVITLGDVNVWHPQAIRASAGLHFAQPVLSHTGLESFSERSLIAVDPEGEAFNPDNIPSNAVYAFGTERRGLSDELKSRGDRVVGLPMKEGVSSMNLATTVAAVLYLEKYRREKQ